MSTGKQIRSNRKALGLSISQVARAAKMSIAYVSEIERGRRRLTERAAVGIARTLGMAPDSLLLSSGRLTKRAEKYLQKHFLAAAIIGRIVAADLDDEQLSIIDGFVRERIEPKNVLGTLDKLLGAYTEEESGPAVEISDEHWLSIFKETDSE